VIRCGAAYPDAVIDRLESDLADRGLLARLEPPGAGAGTVDTAGLIAVELPGNAARDLPREALKITVDLLLDAAQRRRRRQQASGEVRDAGVILHLSGGARIVVTADASTDQTDLLMTAVTSGSTAGTLTAGVWEWDPVALRLDEVVPGE
jgi:hypothetical protein